jgi:hypothetical protein
MDRTSLWCGVLATVAMIASSNAQEIATPMSSGLVVDDAAVSSQAEAQAMLSSGQPALTAIETWLSLQFDLPRAERHPRIEFARPDQIAALRYRGFLANSKNERPASAPSGEPAQSDTVAVYSDVDETIYLPEGWTGSTSTEQSVLVHEMVHHLQNLGGLKYECPQEREKLAYKAQDRWLSLFGHSLEHDFELDGFSLLVKTKCFY